MKISGFDKFLLRAFPGWAESRLRHRVAGEMLARHYEAGAPGRRTSGWARFSGDADLAARGGFFELRLHARDLLRNNGWARRGQRVIANNTVGWGIRPKPISDDPAIVKQAMQLWRTWAGTTECESEGRHTFYGIQHLAMKAIASDGDVLIRRRWRQLKDALSLPMQLQILESDYLDHSKNLFDSDAGGPIVQGIEFDKVGRRAAYWVFDQHPGSGRQFNPSRRIAASEILHIFYCERPGQSRGVSWFAPAILPLKDFDEFEDATLVRQKIAAMFGGFIEDPDGQQVPIGNAGLPDGTTDSTTQSLEPGMMQFLPPGRKITFSNPPAMQEDGSTTRTLRRIAAAIGTTYEDLSGDYSQVNFSSARMGRIAHWGSVYDWQENMLIPLLCQGVWSWFTEAAGLAGELPEDAPPTSDWTCSPMPMIEPDKEALAYSRMIRNGVMTLGEALREQGRDPDEHLEEYAATNKKLDALGIVLDSDPRQTTAAGQAQMDPAEAGAAAGGGDGPPAKKPTESKLPPKRAADPEPDDLNDPEIDITEADFQ